MWHCYQSCRGVDIGHRYQPSQNTTFIVPTNATYCFETEHSRTHHPPDNGVDVFVPSLQQEAAAALTRFQDQAPGANDAPEEHRQLRQPISAAEVDEASNMIFQRTSAPSGNVISCIRRALCPTLGSSLRYFSVANSYLLRNLFVPWVS